MTLNPREYDAEELRSAARKSDDENIRELKERLAEHEQTADEAVRSGQLKQLLFMHSSADEERLQRPYLESMPGKYAAEITLFEWLDFLLERGGVKRSLEAIEYYENIGWVGDEAAEKLRNHVRGFAGPADEESHSDFEMADHVLSLVFIARLASME
ncbi:FlaD/FlaE family flagellar protein [Halobacterium litoreum]|uniref:FlaD/FlaE family flagellar protein n=1 Tax=Halobacterium litoreum TaxID=2039234 RepID=A0ABD5NA27_9EURY|nr:FlaD/FlaE family flagellar protein [Halobacterium litoreum]UHH12021.1 flagella E [Halobacterium litoreum]